MMATHDELSEISEDLIEWAGYLSSRAVALGHEHGALMISFRIKRSQLMLFASIGTLEWWQRKTRAFYKARPVIRQPAKTASKPEQGASSASDYRATASYSKLLTACLGDKAKVERLIDYEIRKHPKLFLSALDRLEMDRSGT